MILDEEFKKYLIEANNIYDLVANCFGALCDNVANHQAFIGKYFGGDSGECNPNMKCLNEFSERVMEEVHTLSHSKYTLFLEKLLQMIDELQLVGYCDDRENQLTVIYCILAAIDTEAANWNIKRLSGTLGPLDRQKRTPYRVYFNMQRTLHGYYVEEVGRQRAHETDFFEMFHSFRFINEENWFKGATVPEVKFVPCGRTEVKGESIDCGLKIGVIQVHDELNFDFVRNGSSVKVSYGKVKQEQSVRRAVCALEKALKEGCNIILFPEYVMSPEVYNGIRQCLHENMRKNGIVDNPYLVFAGSTWTDDDNNVMKVLDSSGKELGEYYKYSPYIEKDSTGHRFKTYEALKNPGKKCDVFAVEGVGVILPAICRDVIDANYTEAIVKSLWPLIVMISAWSPSVASFEERQRDFANKYFTSSVLANACGSVKKDVCKIGNGSIVHKEKTIAGVEIKPVCRENCDGGCSTESCLFVVDYDFFYSDEEKINTNICIQKL